MDAETIKAISQLVAILGAVLIMPYGLRKIFCRLREKNQGFGDNTLKAIGMVLFLPILLILAILGKFQIETLAALFGTIAGYVLSDSKPDRNPSNEIPATK